MNAKSCPHGAALAEAEWWILSNLEALATELALSNIPGDTGMYSPVLEELQLESIIFKVVDYR
jgi:hypothetical protein